MFLDWYNNPNVGPKQFRPNPDAKPFIPNPLTVAATKWHFYSNENGKNVNGVVSPYWMAPHAERENVVVAGSTSNPLKKHIAFHLVSNVLDDEVPEESGKEHLNNVHNAIPYNNNQNNMYGNIMNEQVDSWQNSPTNFSLPLGADKNSDNKQRSINNKSIHEIWSPDPSPNGLNNLSPSDEVLGPYQQQQQHQHQQQQQQQQLLESPNSIIESPDLSFEQVQNEMTSPTFTTGRLQNYDELIEETANDDMNNPTMYNCYPPNMHSPVYNNQYNNYRNINHRPPDVSGPPPHQQQPGDEYQTMFLRKNDMIVNNNDTSSMVVEQQNDYYTFTGYMDRYQPVSGGGNNGNSNGSGGNGGSNGGGGGGGNAGRYHVRNSNKYEHAHHHQPVQLSHDMKMSFMEELGISLDECRDQLKHLERDFRKADANLTQEFRLRRSSGSDGSSLKYPPNSTRVDKLVIDQQREHQKVESLIGRIERLGFTPMHPNVGVALDLWLSGIKDLRNVRKNELANMSESPHIHNNGSKSHMQGDICNLVACVKELTKHTRSARTIVWCALQMLYASIPNGGGSSSGE